MSAAYRLALPAALLVVVGALLAWKMPNLGAQAGGDDLVTESPSPTLAPTTSPTPIPSITPTPSPTPTASLTPTPTPYPVITPCPTVSPTACDIVTYPIGDADCNYAVDERDALGVIGEAAGGTPVPCHDLGNVKCDDGLTVLDALFILQYKAGLTAHIPAWCPPIGAMIFSNFAAR